MISGSPKDTAALLRIFECVVSVNDGRKRNMVRKITQACGGTVRGQTIGVLGVTFKPNTDDVRDSPALVIVPALQAEGARVRIFDPEGMEMAKPDLPGVEWCSDSNEASDGADAMVVLTEWNVFRGLDMERAKSSLRRPLVIDLRNVYDADDMANAGFRYISIGRAEVDGAAAMQISRASRRR